MIDMLKYYCTLCNDTCEYMCEKTIAYLAQPMTTDGKYTCKQYDDSKQIEGSICLLCGAHLPLSPKDYRVDVITVGCDEYIRGKDIWEICKHENVSNR